MYFFNLGYEITLKYIFGKKLKIEANYYNKYCSNGVE